MDVTDRIHLLSTLLPESDYPNPIPSPPASARSLLTSSAVYTAVSSYLTTSPTSGSGNDPICRWLYDAYISSDHDLRLVVLSFVPLIAGNYLSRIHSLSSPALPVAGFEAVLLALYSSETISRAGKPVLISIPDLSQSSPYHVSKESVECKFRISDKLIGVVSNPLEPQTEIKSTRRGLIVGAVFDCYYKQISEMPNWSKLDFCNFAADWAGEDCPCKSQLDEKFEVTVISDGIATNEMEIERKPENVGVAGTRIPLPWELLQPVLRILGHCLWAPLVTNDVKDAASSAARFLYARSSHDLAPRAILASRALIQLHNTHRQAAAIAEVANTIDSDSNTPAKANKPEIQAA